jgi:hypothetical protein
MKKLFILAFALAFTAVSCNTSLFAGGSGSMGVFRSDDLGTSFHAVNTIDKKTNLNNTSVNTLIFDPQNPTTLYLGSSAGLYQSTNSGDTWKLLVTQILVADAAIDAGNNTIYAAGTSGGHGKIIKTSDGGGSWQDLYTEPTSNNEVVTIVLDPVKHNRIFAGMSAGEIIESDDYGSSWQVVTDLHDPIYRMRFGVDHTLYVLCPGSGLYKSADGKTFAPLTGTLTSGLLQLNSDFSAVTRFLDLAFDPRQANVLYLTTDVGLVRSVDGGTTWAFMKMPVRNTVLRTASMAVNPKDSNNLYAVVSNTMFISNNGGVTWQTKPLGTGREVRIMLIDPNNVNTLYLGLGVKK